MPINRASFVSRFPNVTEGMPVLSSDNKKLGKVSGLNEEFLTVEKGVFFPKEFSLRYDDIQDIGDGSVYLKFPSSELELWRDESYTGWRQTEDINQGRVTPAPREEFKDRYADWSKEQVKIPVAEEELEARKTSRQAGEVKVHKIVHTELRHFTVPVMREEVRVERVPVTDRETARPAEGAFEEKTINVPVMEEEVTVSKRPVVKEEVRVSKDRTTEEKKVEGEVRKEEVRVEGEEELKRKRSA